MNNTQKFDKNEYMKNYVKKNIDKYKEHKICKICNGTYQKYNKNHHINTNKHQNALQMFNYKNNLDDIKNLANNVNMDDLKNETNNNDIFAVLNKIKTLN